MRVACRRWLPAMLLLAAVPALADGVSVEGRDHARLVPPAGTLIAPYANAGYRLEVTGDEVAVEVDVAPLRSAEPFALPAGVPADPVARLARALAADARTRYQAVSRVLAWVSRHVRYELDRELPQSAASVLERRSGYCTGIARLSVALLQSLGIPAREVAGWVAGSAAPGTADGYHRWIEVFYPDRGWTFSDPLATHHWVPATYVRLASEQLGAAGLGAGVVLERADRVRPVDVFPGAAPGVRGRKNSARQLAGSLRVVLADGGLATAVLEGRGLRRTRALTDGEGTFVGLEPGSYSLRVLLADGQSVERRLEIAGRVRAAMFLPARLAPAALHGRRSR